MVPVREVATISISSFFIDFAVLGYKKKKKKIPSIFPVKSGINVCKYFYNARNFFSTEKLTKNPCTKGAGVFITRYYY